jgi:hypothetical protein
MTCTVLMKEGAAPEIGLGMKKAMAAIFGAPSSSKGLRRRIGRVAKALPTHGGDP